MIFCVSCYGYGARMYDAALGRWHVPDLLAEYHFNLNPYPYAMNNPLRNIDVNGDSTIVIVSGTETQTRTTTNGQQEYQGYQFSVYENMTLEQYNQLNEAGELPSANYTTYIGRDARYTQKKDKDVSLIELMNFK